MLVVEPDIIIIGKKEYHTEVSVPVVIQVHYRRALLTVVRVSEILVSGKFRFKSCIEPQLRIPNQVVK